MTVFAGAVALIAGGCLGTLHHNRDAETVARAPRAALALPVRSSRPYWLLRQEPGWESAHEVDFGGAAGDRARTIVRVALFRDTVGAAHAFARLTPAYAYRLWRERMRAEPHPVAYPVPLPGDEVRVTEYGLRLPPQDPDARQDLTVQLIVIRAGRAVLVIDSVGIPREDLAPVADVLVRTAHALTAAAP